MYIILMMMTFFIVQPHPPSNWTKKSGIRKQHFARVITIQPWFLWCTGKTRDETKGYTHTLYRKPALHNNTQHGWIYPLGSKQKSWIRFFFHLLIFSILFCVCVFCGNNIYGSNHHHSAHVQNSTFGIWNLTTTRTQKHYAFHHLLLFSANIKCITEYWIYDVRIWVCAVP